MGSPIEMGSPAARILSVCRCELTCILPDQTLQFLDHNHLGFHGEVLSFERGLCGRTWARKTDSENPRRAKFLENGSTSQILQDNVRPFRQFRRGSEFRQPVMQMPLRYLPTLCVFALDLSEQEPPGNIGLVSVSSKCREQGITLFLC